METRQKNTSKNNNASHEQGTPVPATEIARNPNPRANENIQKEVEHEKSGEKNEEDTVGTEITDGEDA